jgi:hypothetical protein
MAGVIRLHVSPHHLDKTNTGETSTRQTRSHSDNATMAAPGMVSRFDQNVNRLSSGFTHNSDVAKTVILSHFSQQSETAQTSHLEVITHDNRGFSQNVFCRISVSQRQSTVQL